MVLRVRFGLLLRMALVAVTTGLLISCFSSPFQFELNLRVLFFRTSPVGSSVPRRNHGFGQGSSWDSEPGGLASEWYHANRRWFSQPDSAVDRALCASEVVVPIDSYSVVLPPTATTTSTTTGSSNSSSSSSSSSSTDSSAAIPLPQHCPTHLAVNGSLQYSKHTTLPRAHDYDRLRWSSVAEVNHGLARDADETAEVFTVISTPMKPAVCFLVESAVRMGYSMTLLTVPSNHWSKHEKQRRTVLYGKLRRSQILRSLGLPLLKNTSQVVDPSVPLNAKVLDWLEDPAPGSLAHHALLEHLEDHRHLYVFADAYDVLFQLPPHDLYAKLRRGWPVKATETGGDDNYGNDARFVISGEANLFPALNQTWFPERYDHMFPFINSGLWVARLDRLIAFSKFIYGNAFEPCKKWTFSDQCKTISALHAFKSYANQSRFDEFPVHTDQDGLIMQSMFPHSLLKTAKYALKPQFRNLFDPVTHLGLTSDGLISRRDVANTPVALHWNGVSKDYNARNLTSAIKDVNAVDFSLYASLGWMRRQLPDGKTPVYFHVSYKQMRDYVHVFGEDMVPSDSLRRDLFTFCTKGLEETVANATRLLKSQDLLLDPVKVTPPLDVVNLPNES